MNYYTKLYIKSKKGNLTTVDFAKKNKPLKLKEVKALYDRALELSRIIDQCDTNDLDVINNALKEIDILQNTLDKDNKVMVS